MVALPTYKNLEPARQLSQKIKKALDFTKEYRLTLYSRLLFNSGITRDQLEDGGLVEALEMASKEVFYREFDSDINNPDSDAFLSKTMRKR